MTISSDKIIALRWTNPCLTLQAIGDQVGVSRERVRQILKRTGLPTKHYKQTYTCIVCRNIITHCGNKYFCSQKCRMKYHRIPVECNYCGKIIKRRISEILHYSDKIQRNYSYCNRTCFGKWLGYNHIPYRSVKYASNKD